MDIYNAVSFAGIFILIIVALLLSESRRNVNWLAVIWGVGIQMFLALFLFVFPVGVKIFIFVNDSVVKILESSFAGSQFVFGRLALPPGTVGENGEKSLGFILAFQAFPAIIFFSALMAVLYYFEIIPKVIRLFSFLFTKLMRISGAESLCAASNIFVGVESAMTVRPFLEKMTRSELCVVLTAGMATVASNVLAFYTFILQKEFPMIAGHLVTASFLSAPAAIVMAKILIPETQQPVTLGEQVDLRIEKEDNVFETIIKGATGGVQLIVGIVALLIAVLGLVSLLDAALAFAGGKINAVFNLEFNWSLKEILGYVFYPFTLIIGIPPSDAGIIAKIIGERAVVTEVAAYQDLADVMAKGLLQHPRSAVLATYALCGFAHVASMAIFVGGVASLVPSQTKTLAQIAFRSLLAATLACLLTACIAGTFYTRGSMLIVY